ncbi:4a-hydroxytetrahydrobiopterin dehydratase [Leptospira interrogans serovar Pomona]|uniref:4a-hydroxytetrahydrobiopterin dehydratase n=1 Tax=Leptospira interrogans serovar Pomona TaxID=44276 RepID=A0AA40W7V5_LEPIR|nr:4a-hydroxytetrahydrobiopterin dehydratase [Leptospira interrogans serovar Pomona str. Pomona]MBE8342234.1 4a-hydroxytetrahydrobiopterin dehydratase [Leptospira interrogans serovar Pomona]MCD1185782.1 4a-hydroxytetrahydrobiopterin dehydratase [Leptospira sp. Pond_2020]OQN92579.1 4a-hydroxytetrahydrobiopterin dehydratase [Leptospira interrogans serovar Lai]MBE8352214.1 4a-hydroxytetrahydrobiopterin dehydratase [Leptospira interrogans serovar Pomona]
MSDLNNADLELFKQKGWEIKFRTEIPLLSKTFLFPTYLSGLEFVNSLAHIAERLDHHPDLFLSYRKVTVEIFTHSKNTITDLDLRFAEEWNKFWLSDRNLGNLKSIYQGSYLVDIRTIDDLEL